MKEGKGKMYRMFFLDNLYAARPVAYIRIMPTEAAKKVSKAAKKVA